MLEFSTRQNATVGTGMACMVPCRLLHVTHLAQGTGLRHVGDIMPKISTLLACQVTFCLNFFFNFTYFFNTDNVLLYYYTPATLCIHKCYD